jgi:ABC-type uncharacterized transport system permease subunit
MAVKLVLSLAALLAMVPAAILPLRRVAPQPDLLYWAVLAAAVAGPAAYTLVALRGAWDSGLSVALWLSITSSLIVFLVLAYLQREAWRLSLLLLPYLLLLGVFALLSTGIGGGTGIGQAPAPWLVLHVAVSLVTYALLTLAAVAGLAALLQERALKHKQPSRFSERLPSIAGAEAALFRLLALAEIVLGAGLVSGMALEYLSQGQLLDWGHKSLLSILAFVLIGVLLLVHRNYGLRGRRAVRLLLLAYLLVTLAYPGVKFVRDVLIG